MNPAVVHTFFHPKLVLLSSELLNLIFHGDSVRMTLYLYRMRYLLEQKKQITMRMVCLFLMKFDTNIKMLVRKQQKNIRNAAVSSEYREDMKVCVINDQIFI